MQLVKWLTLMESSGDLRRNSHVHAVVGNDLKMRGESTSCAKPNAMFRLGLSRFK